MADEPPPDQPGWAAPGTGATPSPAWGTPPTTWGAPTGPTGYGPGAPQTEPLATVALVLSIASFVLCPLVAAIVALVLAARASRYIRESGGAKTGQGMVTGARVVSIVNLVVSALGLVAVVLIAIFVSNTTDYQDLNAGDCFNVSNRIGNRVHEVSCGQPHERQVYGKFEYPAGGVYPGEDTVKAAAVKECATLFRTSGFFDAARLRALQFAYLYPKQAMWSSGTHTIVCAIGPAGGGKLTGDARYNLS